MKIAITGANSSVGKNLLATLAQHTDVEIIAGVRSERAFASLPQAANIKPAVIAYEDPDSLQQAMAGADTVIHLAGILIETRHSNYATANVAATAAVVNAAAVAGAGQLIFISVVGADPEARNAYFRSKASAEQLVEASSVSSSSLRTPLLLGPGTAGAASLLGAARQQQTRILGGGDYVMRPLDVDDLSQALVGLCQNPRSGSKTYELVGPEGISYRELITRTAQKLGHDIAIGSVPIWLAKIGAGFNSIIKGGGISPTVIDVITSDEKVNHNADQELGIQLTTLDGTLDKILAKQASV